MPYGLNDFDLNIKEMSDEEVEAMAITKCLVLCVPTAVLTPANQCAPDSLSCHGTNCATGRCAR